MGSESFLLLAGLLGGAALLARSVWRAIDGDPDERPQGTGVPYDPNANTGASAGEQVVGAACFACDRPFMFATDAKRCPDCKERVHAQCLDGHARGHLPDRPVYR